MPIDGTVLIAGAGIGGLALGCALQQAGISCEIFERAPALGSAGAGIVMQPSALLALRHLGLDAAVVGAGHELERGPSCWKRRPLSASCARIFKIGSRSRAGRVGA
ncbi:MAG: FAD-dependent monooxygenase [Pseudomonadota bacterium]